jgi:RES domain-containing protein
LIHDPDLLDSLSSYPSETFDGVIFRATRQGLSPLTASTSGGRWAPKDECPVLYTSLEREGALAEVSFHLALYTPLPSKPIRLHQIQTSTKRSLRLKIADLSNLGVGKDAYPSLDCQRCQEIGAAVGFLGYDGLIAPSARWACDNLVLFPENHDLTCDLELIASEDVEWQLWAREHGLLDDGSS